MFHGCGASAEPFATKMGYNEFASTNDIIMVYPDSKCWGYNGTITDDKAFTYDGMMPKTIMSMVTRVTTANPDESETFAEFVAGTLSYFLQ